MEARVRGVEGVEERSWRRTDEEEEVGILVDEAIVRCVSERDRVEDGAVVEMLRGDKQWEKDEEEDEEEEEGEGPVEIRSRARLRDVLIVNIIKAGSASDVRSGWPLLGADADADAR